MSRPQAASAEASREKSVARAVLAVLAVSLVLSLVITAAVSNDMSDAVEYKRLATNLLDGHGYSMDASAPYYPSAWRAPGYAVFLATLKSFGIDRSGAALVQAAVCALITAGVFLYTLSCCPSRPMTVAAVCVMLSIPLMAAATALGPEVVNCALVLGAYSLVRRWKVSYTFAAGVLFGLATLFRPENQVVVGVVAVGLAFVCRGARLPLVLVCGFVLTLAPWVLRNWTKVGVLGVVDPIYAYSNLALGTSGDYGDPVGSLRNRYSSGVVSPAERDAYVRLAKDTYVSRWRESPCGVLSLKVRLLARAISYSLDGLHPDDWSLRSLLDQRRIVPLLLRVGSMIIFGPLFVVAVLAGLQLAQAPASERVLALTHLLAMVLLGLTIYTEARLLIPSRLLLAPSVVAGCLALGDAFCKRRPATY